MNGRSHELLSFSKYALNFKYYMQNYKQLCKFKLSSFVVLTAGGGYVAGSEDSINWRELFYTSFGTFGAAACANALNQIYEVSNDKLMNRTRSRPLPTGRLSVPHALAFAVSMGVIGVGTLYSQTNTVTASLGAANIALYAAVYTPLKQLSIANTWVGALVGAIPPMMGWAAATGELSPGSWVLGAALFSWQMPHFLSLAWMYRQDYINGGFRMLSMVDQSGVRTSGVALRHCAVLGVVGAGAYLTGIASPSFAVEAAILAAGFGAYVLSFQRDASVANARRIFKLSLLYLPLLMAGLAAHRTPAAHTHSWEEVLQRASALASEPLTFTQPIPSQLPNATGPSCPPAEVQLPDYLAEPLSSAPKKDGFLESSSSTLYELATIVVNSVSYSYRFSRDWMLQHVQPYSMECPSKVYCEEDGGLKSRDHSANSGASNNSSVDAE